MKPKVLIGLPVGDMVEPGMLESFQQAVTLNVDEGYGSVLHVVPYRVTNQARNILCRKMLSGDWTHIFMLDADMIYPQNTLARLLQDDKDIVAPFYIRKVRGYAPNAFIIDDSGWHTVWADDLKKVNAVGTGGILIKRHVLETLNDPWFEYDSYEHNGVKEQRSEDVVFCERAVERGFEVWVDGRLKCGHVGRFVVYPGEEVEGKPNYGSVKITPYEPADLVESVYGY